MIAEPKPQLPRCGFAMGVDCICGSVKITSDTSLVSEINCIAVFLINILLPHFMNVCMLKIMLQQSKSRYVLIFLLMFFVSYSAQLSALRNYYP